MNVKAAVFASNFIAIISLLAGIMLFFLYGWPVALMGVISAGFWYGLGKVFLKTIKG